MSSTSSYLYFTKGRNYARIVVLLRILTSLQDLWILLTVDSDETQYLIVMSHEQQLIRMLPLKKNQNLMHNNDQASLEKSLT